MTCPNKSTITNYGAVVSLVDAVPVKDSSSELSAVFLNPWRNDVAALTQTQCLAHFQVLGAASAPAITGSGTWTTGIDTVWSSGAAPTVVVNSTANWTVTMPSVVSDSFGNTINVNIEGVKAAVCSGTTQSNFICQVTSSNTFTVIIGAGTNLVGSLIQFWVY